MPPQQETIGAIPPLPLARSKTVASPVASPHGSAENLNSLAAQRKKSLSMSDISHLQEAEIAIAVEFEEPITRCSLRESMRANSQADLRGILAEADREQRPKKSVSFNNMQFEEYTHSPRDYNRTIVKKRRPLAELLNIREELIRYKLTEMEVHKESIQNLHFFKLPG
eukprot:Clim_evm39s153 gene=Clim_evmTU39s153